MKNYIEGAPYGAQFKKKEDNRMIKINFFLLSCLMLLTMISKSQNLIPNPSFEEFYTLPSSTDEVTKCKHWYTPRGLSPDYFHSEATTPKYNYTVPIVSVPKNIFGYQNARTGSAYVGATNYSTPLRIYTFREMIAVKLTEKLKKDSIYLLSFFVSLAESSKYYHNLFGVTFSYDSLANVKTKNGYGKVIAKNSITIKVGSIENDTADWHLVQTKYISKGGEQYLYIGITKKNLNLLSYWITKFFHKTNLGEKPYAYYYIDDVSVIKLKSNK